MKLQQFILRALKTEIYLRSRISKKWAGSRAFQLFCTPLGKAQYQISPVFKQAESLRLDFNNGSLQGYRWNPGGGKKILIAHGFRSHAQKFEHFIPHLISADYEIVAFDAPAHGLSSGNRVTAIDYANLITELNCRMGRFNAYLAHSFGGLAVALAEASQPENRQVKMVLVAPAAYTQTLAHQFLQFYGIRDAMVIEHFYEKINKLSNKNLNWYSLERATEFLKGKILWLHDKNDPIIPVEDAYRIQRMHRPGIEFIFTQGLGHSNIYRDEVMVRKILDFL